MSCKTLILTLLALAVPGAVVAAGQFQPGPRPRLTPVIPNYSRTRLEMHRVDDDWRRTYWLICPNGRRSRRRSADLVYGQPVPPVPASDAPGLLVVLANAEDAQNVVSFWTSIVPDALKSHYYVAVLVPPKWNKTQPALWLTKNNVREVKEATFSTESFAADVVKDVSSLNPINPNRVYLHGVTESGMAAYACSLEDTTPFKGFYILSSVFRSLQLPPLTHAKGRRYYIQASQEDKVTPYWMAAAGRKLLADQGAVVKLAPSHSSHGYGSVDVMTPEIADAIAWLEESPSARR